MRKHSARVVTRVTYISHARAWWWRRRSLWWSGLPRKRNPVGDGLERFLWGRRVVESVARRALYSYILDRVWALSENGLSHSPPSQPRKFCGNSKTTWPSNSRRYVLMSVYETDVTRQSHISWNIYITHFIAITIIFLTNGIIK